MLASREKLNKGIAISTIGSNVTCFSPVMAEALDNVIVRWRRSLHRKPPFVCCEVVGLYESS